jgi:glycyl-tRNA synthetase beta chain
MSPGARRRGQRKPAVSRSRAVQPRGSGLLLEIGTEELPAQFVAPALVELGERATRLLKDSRLEHGPLKTLGTPRRLVLVVESLAQAQNPITMEVMGPARTLAFDAQGKPTKAALGFAAGQGVSVDNLDIRNTAKGDYVFAIKRNPGQTTRQVLPELLATLIGSLSFPKAMRWEESGVRFARPIRWLLALYDDSPVHFKFGGISAGNKTMGHRFLSSGKFLVVRNSNFYAKTLEKACVVVNQEDRRSMIVSQLQAIASQKHGRVLDDESLIEEAVYSVEMPHAIVGGFNPQYLDLPPPVLITAMKEHQGYFSLLKPDGGLLPCFAAVTNMGKQQARIVRMGNERVLAARLADARFFYAEDRKVRLESRIESLKGVIFHQKLGTLHQKVDRLMTLAPKVAYTLEVPEQADVCRRAAQLSKADLTTGMVGEFPMLQGVMGREYALHDGESEAVAHAIAEHYLPRFAEDRIPESLPGKILSLADRLDTLAGFFSVGMVPSGSQDPFALRRHGLAVIRLALEGGLSIDLSEAVLDALSNLARQNISTNEKVGKELERFLVERLRYYAREVGKLRDDMTDAVVSGQPGAGFNAFGVYARIQALQEFSSRAEFDALVIATKRAENITKAAEDNRVETDLLREPVEKELHNALLPAEEGVAGLIGQRKFREALDVLASLKTPIDAFFNGVMVMAEDAAIRRNRLALLVRVRNLFRQYADFSKIQVEGRSS